MISLLSMCIVHSNHCNVSVCVFVCSVYVILSVPSSLSLFISYVISHGALDDAPRITRYPRSPGWETLPYTVTTLHEPVNKRMKSRNSSVTQHDINPPAKRLRAWTHLQRSVPQKLKSIPSEDLGQGSEAPWLHWKCINNWNGPLQVEHAGMEIQ